MGRVGSARGVCGGEEVHHVEAVETGAFLVSVGPAFAHGCHDLGELSVESVKLLSFGSARDEGASVAGYATSAQWRASR